MPPIRKIDSESPILRQSSSISACISGNTRPLLSCNGLIVFGLTTLTLHSLTRNNPEASNQLILAAHSRVHLEEWAAHQIQLSIISQE